jgi:CBS domain-containing protein
VSLILDHLLPLARHGLIEAKIASKDIDKYLGIIEERTQCAQTGARWIMKSLPATGNSASKLTSEILANQKRGEPVHRWPLIEEIDSDEWEHGYRTVGQFMSTDLFTVSPDDLIDLAASVMDWRHIRHVPVEDQEGRLVGLISHRGLLRMMINNADKLTTVREIMIPDPVTVTPSTSSLEAMELMRTNRVGCLPVIEGDQLVGIITSYDFLEATAKLFHQHLTTTERSKTRSTAAP